MNEARETIRLFLVGSPDKRLGRSESVSNLQWFAMIGCLKLIFKVELKLKNSNMKHADCLMI
ncbi:hypothetical protein BLA29_004335 [Euroglyphus maynei]|uniref:Uncharacterized protein n=1 Tax=Euroglyphus maynei TaxID=6958 RepID=A0A1Y3BJN1_EURMA|nr:hypothetical protein BLA29_004335 [Euroglyphus maynei]